MVVFGLGLLAGCGDDRPSRLSVSGQVLIDGQPLPAGNIRFVPEGARPSVGRIDPDGHFALTCYEGEDGAVPGNHRVEVVGKERLDDTSVQWHAPKKYASFRTSGLEVSITEPTDSLTIELTWDGGKPFVEQFTAEE